MAQAEMTNHLALLQILAGLARTSTPIPRRTTLVIVDDNVQSGRASPLSTNASVAGAPSSCVAERKQAAVLGPSAPFSLRRERT
jgi:hypothetical protein